LSSFVGAKERLVRRLNQTVALRQRVVTIIQSQHIASCHPVQVKTTSVLEISCILSDKQGCNSLLKSGGSRSSRSLVSHDVRGGQISGPCL